MLGGEVHRVLGLLFKKKKKQANGKYSEMLKLNKAVMVHDVYSHYLCISLKA